MKFSKIKKIEYFGEGNVFDVEVPDNNNFYLSNGILSHNSVDLDTRYNINYFFIAQFPDDVPDKILRQSKYLMIPQSADVESIRKLLVNAGVVNNPQVSSQKAIQIKHKLEKYDHSWIVINRHPKDGASPMELIVPLAPLSNHLETID